MFKLWNKLELDGLDWSSEKYLPKKDVILTPLFDTIEKKYEKDNLEINYNVLDYAFSWNTVAVTVELGVNNKILKQLKTTIIL